MSVGMFLVLSALVGCKKSQEPEVAAEEPPARDAAAAQTRVRTQMHAQLAVAVDARDAIIAGDLAAARDALMTATDFQMPAEIPFEWSTHFQSFQAAAARGAEAQDFEAASDAVSDMVLACSGCHQDFGVVLSGDAGSPPEDVDAAKMHMARHKWATDQMWMSMLGATDALWFRGVEALSVEPMHEHEAGDMTEEAAALADWIHEMSEFGEDASLETETRSNYYAELLVTCAECHTLMGRGPTE